MDMKTLADVRTLLGHLPKEARARSTWQHAETRLKQAANDGDTTELWVALQMVLQLENVEYGLALSPLSGIKSEQASLSPRHKQIRHRE
jgi:hypothetical protein